LLRPRQSSSGRIALDGSRSLAPRLTKTKTSSPVRPAAPVLTSERTTAHEAPGIRSTHDGATMQPRKGPCMKEWTDITHYAGFDWARDHHAVVIVNAQGEIVADFELQHS